MKMAATMEEVERKHFVLVHGICHGAWCWYKIIPMLKSRGHHVTALDLAASGVKPKPIEQVHTFAEYSKPLLDFMASLPPHAKVILVGHSLGGMNLAFAMEMFPKKISLAVFLTALMPDTIHRPSYVMEIMDETRVDKWPPSDTKILHYGGPERPTTAWLFGTETLSSYFYPLCPIEDLELAKTLLRYGSMFQEDLSKAHKFTDSRYGSINRVFIVCGGDKTINEEFQRWMIKNNGTKNVMEINGVDHMAMISKPQQVCDCLLEIAHRYA